MGISRIYLITTSLCIAGWVWMAINLAEPSYMADKTTCLIKHATGHPCPSCGSTRGVLYLTEGNALGAFRSNPLSYLMALGLIVLPIWLLADALREKRSFLGFYSRAEVALRRQFIAYPLILLILLNWIWNISKGL